MGIEDNTAALASRITRGKFSFVFFLPMHARIGSERGPCGRASVDGVADACFLAVGCTVLRGKLPFDGAGHPGVALKTGINARLL